MGFLEIWGVKDPGNCYMMQLSMLITWVTGAFITFVMYKVGKWKGKSVV